MLKSCRPAINGGQNIDQFNLGPLHLSDEGCCCRLHRTLHQTLMVFEGLRICFRDQRSPRPRSSSPKDGAINNSFGCSHTGPNCGRERCISTTSPENFNMSTSPDVGSQTIRPQSLASSSSLASLEKFAVVGGPKETSGLHHGHRQGEVNWQR